MRSTGVFQGRGKLARDLAQQAEIVGLECILPCAPQIENPQRASASPQRHATYALNALLQQLGGEVAGKGLQFVCAEDQRRPGRQGSACKTVRRIYAHVMLGKDTLSQRKVNRLS